MKKGFLALLVSLALVFLLAPTEVSAAEDWTGWTALTSDGGSLSSGSYYLAGDVTLTKYIIIHKGVTVTIDLNGYTLTGNGSYAVISVLGTLTLTDSSSGKTGKVTGGKSSGVSGGGVSVGSGGSFTMSGGTISNNSAVSGGGVYVASSGSFTMSGGTISSNSVSYYGGGVYVVNGGSFTMSGGTISGNSASSCGGVYVSNGSAFKVSGSPVVSDNTNANVRLYYYTCITLDGELTSGASIGVTTATTPTSDSAVQITTTETNSSYYSSAVNYITSDNANYKVRVNTAGYLELYMASISGSVSISGDAVYGETLTATVSSEVPDGVTYQWMRDGVAIANATSSTYTLTADDVGKSITVVVSHSSYAGSLAATAVTVSKATLTPSISGTMTKTYDGTTEVTAAQGLSITLTGIVAGDEANVSAAVTSYAYDSADVGTNREITATGITLSGTAADCYTLSSDTATVAASITAASLTADMFTVDTTTETYTGSAITKNITSSLTADTDYEVTYSANTNAGTATITITGLGNYTGTLTWNFTIEPKTVSAVLSGTTSKVYDGTTDLPGDNTLTLTLDGVVDVDKDNVTASAVSIAYQDADAGTTKALTVTGITLDGSAAGNYQLSSTDTTASAAEGQYVITPAEQSISYTTGTLSRDINDAAFTNALTQTTVVGAITYTSDNTKVATVDANGNVSIVGAGTAIITATAAATNNYNQVTASYTLTVTAYNYETDETDSSSEDDDCTTINAEDAVNAVTADAAATGDDAEPLLWSALALLCGLGAALTIVYRRKMASHS